MKCTEAKLRKSSIESVATRLYDEAVSSVSADRQVLGTVTSPGRVSVLPSCFNGTVYYYSLVS